MSDNTWPNGYRHTMGQNDHERWNTRNYPGTLQLCVQCDSPTGRCEDDSLFLENSVPNGSALGPLCPECFEDRIGTAGEGEK
jgi:hypothetical protein